MSTLLPLCRTTSGQAGEGSFCLVFLPSPQFNEKQVLKNNKREEEVMMLVTILVVALIGEALWETLKMVWQEGKVSVDRIGAMVVGILLAFGARLDLFVLLGISFVIPYLGYILTGLLLSRGANFVHDLFVACSNLRKGKALPTVQALPTVRTLPSVSGNKLAPTTVAKPAATLDTTVESSVTLNKPFKKLAKVLRITKE